MKKDFFKKAGIAVSLSVALLPLLALAQLVSPENTPLITKPGDVSTLIANVLGWLGGVIFVIGAIMLLWSAFLYLFAGGSDTNVSKAKSYMIYAIVGIAVAILALAVRPFLINVLGGRFY